MKIKNVYAYIINWNGMRFLPDVLPSVISAKNRSQVPIHVVLIDNLSKDQSEHYLRKNFESEIQFHKAKKNAWLYSVEECLVQHKPDIFFLLNNDLKLDADFFSSMLKPFQEEQIAITGANVHTWNGEGPTLGVTALEENKIPLNFARDVSKAVEPAKVPYYPTAFVSGGACAIRLNVYKELGGFDPLFYPAYFEDADLCLRAWQKNYQVVFVPSAKCFHFGGGSRSSAWDTFRSKLIASRSELLFSFKYQWKEKKHQLLFYLMKRLLKDWCFSGSRWLGYVFALFRLGQVKTTDIRSLNINNVSVPSA